MLAVVRKRVLLHHCPLSDGNDLQHLFRGGANTWWAQCFSSLF